jgi:hypothetical protein
MPTEKRIAPWSERHFAFGVPMQEQPFLMERLRGAPVRLQEMLRGRSIESARLQLTDRWCVLEHIAHLNLIQDKVGQRLEDFGRMSVRLSTVDLSEQDLLLHAQRGRGLGDVIEEFRIKRNYFVRCAEVLSPKAKEHYALHPCLQARLRLVDQLYVLAEHDDHHFAHIRELLAD